ncbi:MAG: NFACT RNA binding domain-containing protein, partial [Clostridium sp.]|nr:NFACT RNA binding domain-containing protein [Clostridium sp.]
MIFTALDGIFIYSILWELKNNILNGKVSKVNQPEKDEISLLIRSKDNKNCKLLISASSSYPKIHLTEKNKQNPLKAPMFCMVLRKYLINAKIVEIKQFQSDRIVIINFENSDEFGFNSVYSLIVEIMGRHSNITLIRGKDNIIMDSIKHITPEINRFRSLYPGIEYVYPPKSEKLNPFDFDEKKLSAFITENNLILDEKLFSKIFTGISKPLSKELFFRFKEHIENNDINALSEDVNNFFNDLKNFRFSFNSYSKNGLVKEFSPVKFTNLNQCEETHYASPSKLLENFYFAKDKSDRLSNYSSDLQKIVHTNIERCLKKEAILNKNLVNCKSKGNYRLKGELLTANIYALKKGDSKVNLQNYYSDNLDDIEIKLNPNKTPSQNVQYYYKRYDKLKTTEKMSKVQLESNSQEMDYLQSVLTNIINCDDYNEIEEIKKELIETGYIKFNKKHKKKSSKSLKPMHFISSDNIDIYVGKNNFQNDYLTLKFADKRDIWMHTKKIPGSHVIIKNMGNVPDKTL